MKSLKLSILAITFPKNTQNVQSISVLEFYTVNEFLCYIKTKKLCELEKYFENENYVLTAVKKKLILKTVLSI